MANASRRVTLSKAERASPAGGELVALLTELSDDGIVTRDEMARLRSWLEVDRGVEFTACAFLYEVIDTMAADGEIAEEELDTLALAIERVLPPEVRKVASERRKQLRAARRQAQVDAREADRSAARQAREVAKPLQRGDFIIAGALRSAERREACEGLSVGESVVFEREPDNRHDGNAILILNQSGDELGYVPREDAKRMAPLLDAGGWADTTVKKLIESAAGHTLPVVVSKLYRSEAQRLAQAPRPSRPAVIAETALTATLFGHKPRHVVTSPPPRAVKSWMLVSLVLAIALAAYLLTR